MVEYCDMDVLVFGFLKGQMLLLDLLIKFCLMQIFGFVVVSLVIGVSIVSGVGYDVIDVEMVDMEIYVILCVCQKFGLLLVGLCGILDGVVELVYLDDWM